jgi:hypothetical protein
MKLQGWLGAVKPILNNRFLSFESHPIPALLRAEKARRSSFPNSIWQRIFIHRQSALWAHTRIGPWLDCVPRRNRACRFKRFPSVPFYALNREPAQCSLECRGHHGGFAFPKDSAGISQGWRRGNSELCNRVVEFFALDADNCLDEEIRATIGFSRENHSIATARTFEPVRASHAVKIDKTRNGTTWETGERGRRRSGVMEGWGVAESRCEDCSWRDGLKRNGPRGGVQGISLGANWGQARQTKEVIC